MMATEVRRAAVIPSSTGLGGGGEFGPLQLYVSPEIHVLLLPEEGSGAPRGLPALTSGIHSSPFSLIFCTA